MKTKLILRIVEVVIVVAAIAVLGVKGVKSDAYDEYVKQGGERSFWSWVMAGDDLGFEPITKDRTANLKTSSIMGFTNKGGDTTISGGINAWHDDHFTVTLTVKDKAYSAETKAQSNAAYESGLADSVDARIEVWGKDYTENKMRVNEFLGQ